MCEIRQMTPFMERAYGRELFYLQDYGIGL